MFKFTSSIIALLIILTLGSIGANARDQIRIVGSSTVFPFSTVVAEKFGRGTQYNTPVVESTGTGGGFKLFCQGIGVGHPDITNASRKIKKSEIELCAINGVTEITEIKIGYDGIVIANSKQGPKLDLTVKDIFLALAKNIPSDDQTILVPNSNVYWSDIRSELPHIKIEIYGPPPTSGTRDAFVELAMESGAKTYDFLKDLYSTDKNAFKQIAHTIRDDGVFIEAGENDNLIIQKLTANPYAYGIFGFSFLDQNYDVIQGSRVDSVEPEFELIADGSYPIARSLYFYVKNAHIGIIPGLKDYIEEFVNDRTWGEYGYLADKGLIPMPDKERNEWRKKALKFIPLE